MIEGERTRKMRKFAVYLAGFFLSFHYASVVYVNSSFLKQFLDTKVIGVLYIIGSIIGITLFVKAPKILRRIGNFKASMIFILLELIATTGMAIVDNPTLLVLFFLLFQSVTPLIFFSLDIFLEHEQGRESTTGASRGIFLTFQNVAWIAAPLAAGLIGENFGLSRIYLLSSLFIFPLFINLCLAFRKYKDREIPRVKFFDTWRSLKDKLDIKKIFFGNTLLQFFYSIMVIYLPILLVQKAGFEWGSIGVLLTIMLLPFLLLELPLGYLADKKMGEKEIMRFGFVVMAVSTFVISLISSSALLIWGVALFATRVGASSVEISNESYFFKHVKDRDANVISIFRMTRPLSYVLAPIFAIPILLFTSYSGLFAAMGIFTLLGQATP